MQNFILKNINRFINKADTQAAAKIVEDLKVAQPEATNEEIVDQLIRRKCRQAGSIGAVTSGAAIIPGLGTVAAMTFGVAADIGMTFKLQAELVLEIAAAYDYELKEVDKQKIILSITGISAGSQAAVQKAGQHIATKATAQLAQKSIAKAIPFFGVAASGGTNIVTTYIIGRRAQAYFSLGPDQMEDWKDGLRAVSGINEQEIIGWLGETTESSWQMLSGGAKSTKDSVIVTSQNTGTAIIVYSKKAAGAVTSTGGQLIGSVSEGTTKLWNSVTNRFSWNSQEKTEETPEAMGATDLEELEGLADKFAEAEIGDQHVIGIVGAGDDIDQNSSLGKQALETLTSAFSWRPESWQKSDGSTADEILLSEIIEAKMPQELVEVELETDSGGFISRVGKLFKSDSQD
ncbi:MAG: hypothetical protein AB8G95_17595 [Anaerolineae bacterium]